MPEKLDDGRIQTSLQKLHADWTLNPDSEQIQRTFSFSNYYQTMAFANSVAWIAHQQDHHPELTINYKTCLIKYSTHSVNGLSELDFSCAEAIDSLIES